MSKLVTKIGGDFAIDPESAIGRSWASSLRLYKSYGVPSNQQSPDWDTIEKYLYPLADDEKSLAELYDEGSKAMAKWKDVFIDKWNASHIGVARGQ